MTAKLVEVWRLEHVRCRQAGQSGHGPFKYLNGKYVSSWNNNNCGKRPDFGMTGTAPASIPETSRCGVTRNQLESWWSFGHAWLPDEWARAGWHFVIYTVPKTRVRWDRQQIVFNPANALSKRRVPWDDVPARNRTS